ncbi:MAG TPA: hypothetical protein VL551_19770 [Actinospica sp.]|jgi:hypothetical protein|nr:hypothetical protein [Actinospica sp.]
MTSRRAAVPILATVLTLLLAGCATLAPSIPVGNAPTSAASTTASQSAQATATATLSVTKVSAAAQARAQQLGIQVYWHTNGTTTQVESAATKVLDYVVGLGANSVGLTFPIYTDGQHPTKVYGVTGSTPSPATLDLVIKAAQARGLRVMLRPLIDETNLKTSANAWRGTIDPPSVSGWFASYRTFLTPYLQLAQQDSVNYFDVGVELVSLDYQSTQWGKFDTYAAGIYHGELDYSDNWTSWQNGGSYAPASNIGVDAYPDTDLTDGASVGKITDTWETWLEHRSSSVLEKTVLQEVGISAAHDAYQHPAAWGSTSTTPKTSIQVNWFAGACAAAQALQVAGIYFWDVDSYAEPAAGATSDTGSFIGRGDQSIKACFASGWSE